MRCLCIARFIIKSSAKTDGVNFSQKQCLKNNAKTNFSKSFQTKSLSHILYPTGFKATLKFCHSEFRESNRKPNLHAPESECSTKQDSPEGALGIPECMPPVRRRDIHSKKAVVRKYRSVYNKREIICISLLPGNTKQCFKSPGTA